MHSSTPAKKSTNSSRFRCARSHCSSLRNSSYSSVFSQQLRRYQLAHQPTYPSEHLRFPRRLGARGTGYSSATHSSQALFCSRWHRLRLRLRLRNVALASTRIKSRAAYILNALTSDFLCKYLRNLPIRTRPGDPSTTNGTGSAPDATITSTSGSTAPSNQVNSNFGSSPHSNTFISSRGDDGDDGDDSRRPRNTADLQLGCNSAAAASAGRTRPSISKVRVRRERMSIDADGSVRSTTQPSQPVQHVSTPSGHGMQTIHSQQLVQHVPLQQDQHFSVGMQHYGSQMVVSLPPTVHMFTQPQVSMVPVMYSQPAPTQVSSQTQHVSQVYPLSHLTSTQIGMCQSNNDPSYLLQASEPAQLSIPYPVYGSTPSQPQFASSPPPHIPSATILYGQPVSNVSQSIATPQFITPMVTGESGEVQSESSIGSHQHLPSSSTLVNTIPVSTSVSSDASSSHPILTSAHDTVERESVPPLGANASQSRYPMYSIPISTIVNPEVAPLFEILLAMLATQKSTIKRKRLYRKKVKSEQASSAVSVTSEATPDEELINIPEDNLVDKLRSDLPIDEMKISDGNEGVAADTNSNSLTPVESNDCDSRDHDPIRLEDSLSAHLDSSGASPQEEMLKRNSTLTPSSGIITTCISTTGMDQTSPASPNTESGVKETSDLVSTMIRAPSAKVTPLSTHVRAGMDHLFGTKQSLVLVQEPPRRCASEIGTWSGSDPNVDDYDAKKDSQVDAFVNDTTSNNHRMGVPPPLVRDDVAVPDGMVASRHLFSHCTNPNAISTVHVTTPENDGTEPILPIPRAVRPRSNSHMGILITPSWSTMECHVTLGEVPKKTENQKFLDRSADWLANYSAGMVLCPYEEALASGGTIVDPSSKHKPSGEQSTVRVSDNSATDVPVKIMTNATQGNSLVNSDCPSIAPSSALTLEQNSSATDQPSEDQATLKQQLKVQQKLLKLQRTKEKIHRRNSMAEEEIDALSRSRFLANQFSLFLPCIPQWNDFECSISKMDSMAKDGLACSKPKSSRSSIHLTARQRRPRLSLPVKVLQALNSVPAFTVPYPYYTRKQLGPYALHTAATSNKTEKSRASLLSKRVGWQPALSPGPQVASLARHSIAGSSLNATRRPPVLAKSSRNRVSSEQLPSTSQRPTGASTNTENVSIHLFMESQLEGEKARLTSPMLQSGSDTLSNLSIHVDQSVQRNQDSGHSNRASDIPSRDELMESDKSQPPYESGVSSSATNLIYNGKYRDVSRLVSDVVPSPLVPDTAVGVLTLSEGDLNSVSPSHKDNSPDLAVKPTLPHARIQNLTIIQGTSQNSKKGSQSTNHSPRATTGARHQRVLSRSQQASPNPMGVNVATSVAQSQQSSPVPAIHESEADQKVPHTSNTGVHPAESILSLKGGANSSVIAPSHTTRAQNLSQPASKSTPMSNSKITLQPSSTPGVVNGDTSVQSQGYTLSPSQLYLAPPYTLGGSQVVSVQPSAFSTTFVAPPGHSAHPQYGYAVTSPSSGFVTTALPQSMYSQYSPFLYVNVMNTPNQVWSTHADPAAQPGYTFIQQSGFSQVPSTHSSMPIQPVQLTPLTYSLHPAYASGVAQQQQQQQHQQQQQQQYQQQLPLLSLPSQSHSNVVQISSHPSQAQPFTTYTRNTSQYSQEPPSQPHNPQQLSHRQQSTSQLKSQQTHGRTR